MKKLRKHYYNRKTNQNSFQSWRLSFSHADTLKWYADTLKWCDRKVSELVISNDKSLKTAKVDVISNDKK